MIKFLPTNVIPPNVPSSRKNLAGKTTATIQDQNKQIINNDYRKIK